MGLRYRHFDSKQALYLALLERHRADLATFPGLIPTEGTLEQRLRTVLEAWFSYVETHSYAWKMLFRDRGGGRVSRAGIVDAMTRVWVGLLSARS